MSMSFSAGRPVHVSLGSYRRIPPAQAVARALREHPSDPILGPLSTDKLQLCPQNPGRLDVDFAQDLVRAYPGIEWRLHGNVQIDNHPRIVDLCDFREEYEWFAQVGRISAALKAPVYTAHAGRSESATIHDVIDNARAIEQLIGMPVGIEGHYAQPHQGWLFCSWSEYGYLLETEAHYVIDLSHLHILAMRTDIIEWTMVEELLSNPRCLEVHLSDNNGKADQHRPLSGPTWWLPLLPKIHPGATIFYEGRLSPAVSRPVSENSH